MDKDVLVALTSVLFKRTGQEELEIPMAEIQEAWDEKFIYTITEDNVLVLKKSK